LLRRPRVVDLFSGAGGFARGFKEAGFEIVAAVDNGESAAVTYKYNFPLATVIIEDIKELSASDILHNASIKETDVVIGSPPCEPFTGANPRRELDPLDRLYKDPMGILTIEFVRLVGELKPRVFVMENVPAMMVEPIVKALKMEFESVGYKRIYFTKLRAEDYGTPSRRTRLFVSNVPLNPKKLNKRITVREALDGLPPPGTGFPNHEVPPLSERKLKKVVRVKPGQALYYYQGATGRYPNYIKIRLDDIAPTVLGSSRFIHPIENRLLTVREQARLMGFPDHHVFFGGRDQQYNQVGEAVPPPLARAIAEYILENYFK